MAGAETFVRRAEACVLQGGFSSAPGICLCAPGRCLCALGISLGSLGRCLIPLGSLGTSGVAWVQQRAGCVLQGVAGLH